MNSYLEANARQRIGQLLDSGSFVEFLPPAQRVVSPHLAQLDAPVSFDDGVVVGCGLLHGRRVFAACRHIKPKLIGRRRAAGWLSTSAACKYRKCSAVMW